MKSVNSRPDTVAKLGNHGHNLSFDFAFTSPVGYLLPVMYDFLNPGETVDIDLNLETITNPLAKPALTKISEHIDVFFVPLRKLFTIAPELLTNVDDITSSMFGTKSSITSILGTSGYVVKPLNLENLLPVSFEDDYTIGDTVPETKANVKRYAPEMLGATRLLEHLGYNPDVWSINSSQWTNADDYQPDINPFNLLAYQAIYYDYYRLSNFTANNIYAYNADYCMRNGWDYEYVRDMCKLHVRPYRRDYFKNIEPSPLASSLGLIVNPSDIVNVDFQYMSRDGFVTSDDQGQSFVNSNVTGVYNDYSSDTAALRSSFALEKYLRITARAGKHFDDQILAHFGVKIPKSMSMESQLIGSFRTMIDFGTVISTAEGDTTPLGTLAGRGYSVKGNGSHIKYKAATYGILMAIYSAEPSLMYHSGIDKLNTRLSNFDYFQPEFDHIGMQPLFGYEFRAADSVASTRYGWQWRYSEFKQKYDRCTYAFTNEQHGYDVHSDLTLGYGFGPYRAYVISDQHSGSYANASQFVNSLYVQPTDTDQIFLVGFNPLAGYQLDEINADTTDAVLYDLLRDCISNQYATDPFINNFSCRYFKTSKMSTFSDAQI